MVWKAVWNTSKKALETITITPRVRKGEILNFLVSLEIVNLKEMAGDTVEVDMIELALARLKKNKNKNTHRKKLRRENEEEKTVKFYYGYDTMK